MAILDRLSPHPTFSPEQMQAMEASRAVIDIATHITADTPQDRHITSGYIQRRLCVPTECSGTNKTTYYDITTLTGEPELHNLRSHRLASRQHPYTFLQVALAGRICISTDTETSLYYQHDLYTVSQPGTSVDGLGLICTSLNKYNARIMPASLQARVAYTTQTLGIARLSKDPERVRRRDQRRVTSGKWYPKPSITALEPPTLQNAEQAAALADSLYTIYALGRLTTRS